MLGSASCPHSLKQAALITTLPKSRIYTTNTTAIGEHSAPFSRTNVRPELFEKFLAASKQGQVPVTFVYDPKANTVVELKGFTGKGPLLAAVTALNKS